MKIILSVEPIRYPLTGIGHYTLELARHLAVHPEIEALCFFADGRFLNELPSAIGQPASATMTVLDEMKRRLARNRLVLETYRFLRGKTYKQIFSGMDGWLYHGPNYYLPPTPGSAVVTFHDLSVLTMPECHPIERVRYMSKEIEVSLKRATFIITDSDYVRDEVVKSFSWPSDRIRTVHLASRSEFFPRTSQGTDSLLQELGLSHNGYTLYAGTIEPRKNLISLLSAYERLDPRLRRRYPLILAGYRGWNNEAIMERIVEAENQGWVRYLGYVPDVILPSIFSAARLFVFPSLHEGFGLPVLEAMVSGVPVVCSNRSALPEVAGVAAAMCDPDDVDKMSELIAAGLEDKEWRQQLITAGFAQAAKFSWDRCASETVLVYKDVIALSS